jgi:hypothetical protein
MHARGVSVAGSALPWNMLRFNSVWVPVQGAGSRDFKGGKRLGETWNSLGFDYPMRADRL